MNQMWVKVMRENEEMGFSLQSKLWMTLLVKANRPTKFRDTAAKEGTI